MRISAPSACDGAPCSEVCLLTDEGGHTCACSAGKTLNYDKRTCTGDNNNNLIQVNQYNNGLIQVNVYA